MRKGFIFDHNKCVDCNACSAACILENGWTVHPRNIYTYNFFAENILPVINLSLACNHCENAPCMKGCPTSAFSRDVTTGAILLNDKKCIGCKYCQWNCPYDATKFDVLNKTMVKCNLCYQGINEGRSPACSTACPTGALQYGEMEEPAPLNTFNWFPDKGLMPSIEFKGETDSGCPKIYPATFMEENHTNYGSKARKISDDLSLVVFSFLSTLSVSLLLSSLVRGVFSEYKIILTLAILAGLASLFHLGKKFRSWRAVLNIISSPLSREILAYVIYISLLIMSVISRLPSLLYTTALIGLIFLCLIDQVYIFPVKNKTVLLHNGQSFLSALTIASFISGAVLPFIFMAFIKILMFFFGSSYRNSSRYITSFRFMGMAFMVVPGLNMVLTHSYPDLPVVLIFLAGELIDRILFYVDFTPLNIKSSIDEQLIRDKYEKEKY
jgi:Fe-S-cluster-containing dehydrogenase component/DMSO reductase anchor subunit